MALMSSGINFSWRDHAYNLKNTNRTFIIVLLCVFFKNKSNIRRKIQPQAIGPKKIFFCEIEFYEFVSKKVEKCSSNNMYIFVKSTLK